MKPSTLVTISASLMAIMPALASAQPAPIPYHAEPFVVDSGEQFNTRGEEVLAFSAVVQSPGAPWLRVHFADYRLGPGSYIILTSALDAAWQRLDADSLVLWRNSSAFFNGDAVTVDLFIAPGDDAFFRIDDVTVGEWVGAGFATRSLCGQDNRLTSSAPAVGRIMPVGCTGWIVSNGAFLTAGHCMGAAMQTLQFNVPVSLCDGTPQNPPPQDQYPITTSVGFNDGNGQEGNDWCVFNTGPNANTGVRAIRAQGNPFYRMSRDDNPITVIVTGFGTDSSPGGCAGSAFNGSSQTNQTDSGAYLRETIQGPSDVEIEYTVDTEGGNSGSPVVMFSSNTSIGIHTNAGCNPPNTGNSGTGFEHDNLENAIQTFPGPVVRYVDVGHPAAIRDGTIFRPSPTVTTAVAAIPNGGIISIVAGNYTAAAGNTFVAGIGFRPMTLQAPVGAVVIGN